MSLISGYNKQYVTTGFYSGTAATGTADVNLHIMPAPFGGITVTNAYAVTQDAVAGNGSNYLQMVLVNGGTSGTATTAFGTAGGTAGWTAQTPKTATLNAAADEFTVGEWLIAKFDVTGTITLPQSVNVTIEYVNGKG